ncbi:unnamed protein product [Cylicocyclus nassatus]|uniref:Uncharacterized protein n=1 Tax=Cylicocyclus nassatus TaxID=53992 RepID=A0AA36GTN9_CYLNA|nr:unnamed protein product [Cylicocyclus nassatus]
MTEVGGSCKQRFSWMRCAGFEALGVQKLRYFSLIYYHFFRVIGGYPTVIDSFYPTLKNVTSSDSPERLPPLWDTSSSRVLNWSCDAFPGDSNTCVSTITADKCRKNSQYSVGFWRTANYSCIKNGQLVSCAEVTLEGDVCRDVVISIRNSSTSYFELNDLKLHSLLTQTYFGRSDMRSECHHPGYPLITTQPLQLLQAGANGYCEPSSTLLQFGINRTTQCIVDISAMTSDGACPPLVQLRNTFVSNVSYICNCGLCQTPVLRDRVPKQQNNSTACLIPHMVTVTIVHSNGYINGAHVGFDYRTTSPRESTALLTTRLLFVQYQPPCKKTRFELKRGLFHCPSDVTCWQELWLPFSDVLESTVSPIGSLVIILALALLILRNGRKKGAECDCAIARKLYNESEH